MPLGDVAGLAFSHGVFVLFLTPLLMKEQVSKGAVPSVVLGTIGAIVIANPSADMHIAGCFLSLSSGFFMALSTVFIRILSETDSSDTILFYFSLMSAFMVCLCAKVTGVEFVWCWEHFDDLIVAAGSGSVAQILLTVAITYITPSISSIIAYTTILWMGLFGYILYGEVPELTLYIGSVFIIAAGVYMTVIRLRYENIKKIVQ